MRRPSSPESQSGVETPKYKSQTIQLDSKFGFGHTFYEVEAGVVQATEKLAQLLQESKASPKELKRNSSLMNQFSDLAILSQRIAGIRVESAATMKNQTGTDREKIIKIIDTILPLVRAKRMWDDHSSNKYLAA